VVSFYSPPSEVSSYSPPSEGPSYSPPSEGPSYSPPSEGSGVVSYRLAKRSIKFLISCTNLVVGKSGINVLELSNAGIF
jgi:hypothetical protein